MFTTDSTFSSTVFSDCDLLRFDTAGEWLYAPGKNDDWLEASPEGKAFRLNEHAADLDTLYPSPHRQFDEGVLFYVFDSPTAGVAYFGMGLDWYYTIAINHEIILDLWENGNDLCPPYFPYSTRVFLPVRQGRNLLTIRTKRGLYTGTFCCDCIDLDVEKPRIAQGPWLTIHSTASRTVRFVTDCRCGAAVQYRIKGETQWLTAWDHEKGRVMRRTFHAIPMDNLQSGKTYEYRFMFIIPSQPEIRYIPDDMHTFEVADALCENVSFFFTADMQQFDDAPEKQQEVLCSLLELCKAQDCDFFCLGGDTGSSSDMQRLIAHTLIPMEKFGLSEKPLSFLRGNHEYRGEDSDVLPRYMGDRQGNFYSMFRMGNTAFLTLDCYEDRPASLTPEMFRRYNLDGVLIEQEEKFLADVLNSPEWKEAKFRVVLAHGAGYSQFDPCFTMPFTVQRMTDAYFKGKHPVSTVNLWLAGHTHHYTRSIPGTDDIAAFRPPLRPQAGGTDYIFPVWTGTGRLAGSNIDPINASAVRVDISGQGLMVTSYGINGSIIEKVFYDESGVATEFVSLKHYTVAPLPADQPAIHI